MDEVDKYAKKLDEMHGRLKAIYERREKQAWFFGFWIGFMLGLACANWL